MSILDLPPMPDDADPILAPGLLRALGVTRPADPDFQASIDGGFTESFEDFCNRISKERQ
ncbi:hypothetical protein ACIQPQ_31570 [Streptomyces sp. NPDC091281]|uniref:hypothetical protein n=1 Tax=Streptomyces sp. NPDC091281 TaxID=3365985 RepID=UPI003805D7AF